MSSETGWVLIYSKSSESSETGKVLIYEKWNWQNRDE
jgi:hypothetical protein